MRIQISAFEELKIDKARKYVKGNRENTIAISCFLEYIIIIKTKELKAKYTLPFPSSYTVSIFFFKPYHYHEIDQVYKTQLRSSFKK